MEEHTSLAPEYRYFVVDLMTDRVLVEVPFYAVSYERAIKGAGEFSGRIGVLEKNRHLDLYDNTTPGNTGIYVVRDGICVWGGIIWNRSYNIVDQVLDVSASEFTSYFYHRRIWKTWNHEFGATVTVGGGIANVVFDNGSTTALVPGSAVHLSFYEPSDFKLNGYYKVASTPSPTRDTFSIPGGVASADIINLELTSNVVTVKTQGPHGFADGDLVTITSSLGAPFNGTYSILNLGGEYTNFFSYTKVAPNVDTVAATGTATRPVPDGIYTDVTVTVRADTYGYIRGLIDAVAQDFVGIDFPNAYIEPGLSYKLDIINLELGGGIATVTTAGDHNLAVGQAVQIINTYAAFNGEYIVTEVPYPNVFRYAKGGTQASTARARQNFDISTYEAANGIVTITTSTAHNYEVGETVSVACGYDLRGNSLEVNGEFVITAVPSTTKFQYLIYSSVTIPPTPLTRAYVEGASGSSDVTQAKITTSVVTLTTATPHGLSAGQQINVNNVNHTVPLLEKSLNSTASEATIETDGDHYFLSGLAAVPVATNLNTNPSVETASGTVEVSRNFIPNPSGQVNTTGWLPIGGSLGINVGSNMYASTTTAGIGGGNIGMYISLASVVGAGANQLKPSTIYTFSADTNAYNQNGPTATDLGALFFVQGSGVPSAQTASWSAHSGYVRHSVTFTTGTSGDVIIYLLNASATTTGTNYYSLRYAVLVEGSYQAPYFDGSYAATADFTYSWLGTANNSQSVRSAVGVAGYSGGAAVLSQSTTGVANASKAMRITSKYFGGGSAFAELPGYPLTGAPAAATIGKTYTLLATVTVTAVRSTAAFIWAGFNGSSGFTFASQYAPNAPGTYTLRLIYTVPVGTTDHYVRLYNSATTGEPDVFYDKILLTEGTYFGEWFSGASTDTADAIYAWTGTANASTSNKTFRSGVTIAGLRDSSPIVRKETSGTNPAKVITLTTDPPHNFAAGEVITINNLKDEYNVVTKAITSNVATLTTQTSHNLSTGNVAAISGIMDSFTVDQKRLLSNVATIRTTSPHNFQVNDDITVTNITDTLSVVQKEAQDGIATITTSAGHNYLRGEKVTVSGLGAPFDGEFPVLDFTFSRIMYEVENDNTLLATATAGSVVGSDSVFNGTFTITARTSTTLSFNMTANDVAVTAVPNTTAPAVTGISILNGTYSIASTPTSTTFTYARIADNLASTPIPLAVNTEDKDDAQAQVSVDSTISGNKTIVSVTRNTIILSATLNNAVPSKAVSGATASANSLFNGVRTITSTTSDTFKYTQAAPNNVLETSTNLLASATAYNIYNGRFVVTSVPSPYTLTYTRAHTDIPLENISSIGKAVVAPTAIVSTFGPFTASADIGLDFSTRQYSGVNVMPTPYRGFEMTNVGEALDAYSDSIDGFEYRVDCSFDPVENKFSRTFVLIPINFPDPPEAGEVSPLSRFGADKLVFEYPGNISNLSIEESAENSATRFFAIGENDLGPDAGPPFSVATAEDMLNGINGGRKWPLMDEDEKISDIDDETVLYAYAKRYLSESRPPDAKLSVTVIGSLQPLTGTYAPGDWCSLIVDDEFLRQRLASDLEPRDDVIVRKIDSYKVAVPDGTAFPEKVTLVLVPEWGVQ